MGGEEEGCQPAVFFQPDFLLLPEAGPLPLGIVAKSPWEGRLPADGDPRPGSAVGDHFICHGSSATKVLIVEPSLNLCLSEE